MNHVILTGWLNKAPEIRYTSSNKAVASFFLSVPDGKNKEGEKRYQRISCVAWEKTAEMIGQYFAEGDPITVIGKITTRSYEKNDEKRYVTEVTVNSVEFPPTKKVKDAAPLRPFSEIADEDGELPF